MNVVFISPHFPLNFWHFVAALRDAGANALAIADEPWERLHPELQAALTEYYRVPDMHRYEDMVKGMGFLTFRHGKVDKMLWVSLVLVTVFGSMTLIFQDETFIKWKPTILTSSRS